jgi:hypothetical protein
MSKDKKDPTPEAPTNVMAPPLDPESDLPPDADLEERFNDFWKKNGVGIFGGIALGAVVVVGIQSVQYLGERKEASLRAEYAEASSAEAKLAFSETHPDHQLAGMARLSVADIRFEEGEFLVAADLYAGAANAFEDTPFLSRALLGQGVSLIRGGETEKGHNLLEAVALDSEALDNTRAEAAYHMAVSQWEGGDIEAALDSLDIIAQLPAAFIWSSQATRLRERLAATQDAVVASEALASPGS